MLVIREFENLTIKLAKFIRARRGFCLTAGFGRFDVNTRIFGKKLSLFRVVQTVFAFRDLLGRLVDRLAVRHFLAVVVNSVDLFVIQNAVGDVFEVVD